MLTSDIQHLRKIVEDGTCDYDGDLECHICPVSLECDVVLELQRRKMITWLRCEHSKIVTSIAKILLSENEQ